jgi:uncharacterized protein YrrD
VDLGPPISYDVLERGTPVYGREGQEVGAVEHVLAAEAEDIFDGLVVDVRVGPGGLRFADAEQVESIHERGVVLGIGADAAARLPEPAENPPAMRVDPAETDDSLGQELERKLKRAWDLISGNY